MTPYRLVTPPPKGSAFREFTDTLNTPGGQMLFLLTICILAVLANYFKIPGTEGIQHDAFIALLVVINAIRSSIVKAGADSTVQVNNSPNQPTQENKQ